MGTEEHQLPTAFETTARVFIDKKHPNPIRRITKGDKSFVAVSTYATTFIDPKSKKKHNSKWEVCLWDEDADLIEKEAKPGDYLVLRGLVDVKFDKTKKFTRLSILNAHLEKHISIGDAAP